jgi:hypothetical protein
MQKTKKRLSFDSKYLRYIHEELSKKFTHSQSTLL